jgi:hypothetical protein
LSEIPKIDKTKKINHIFKKPEKAKELTFKTDTRDTEHLDLTNILLKKD